MTLFTTDYVANGSFASLRKNVKTYKEPNYAIMVKTQDFSTHFSRDLTYTDADGYFFLRKSQLHGGELMLSNIGASIGKAYIIPNLNQPMTLAPNSIIAKCSDETTTHFLRYTILSFYGQEILKNLPQEPQCQNFPKRSYVQSSSPSPHSLNNSASSIR